MAGQAVNTLYRRRVYPLDAHDLTEEQIAVAFAMTSRRPEPFDDIARLVSQEKAADFHERWVLGYGHASVAEHAVVHLAVENISRLACDALEDNRLASYTEKSSRYQVMPEDYFYFPPELEGQPALGKLYRDTCRQLFQHYYRLLDGCMDYLRSIKPQGEREREPAYNLRLRREATDSCRAVLPAATLTNVGVTANARTLEHAISKLMSSELAEEREVGQELREQGRRITPTLIKYAEENQYIRQIPQRQRDLSRTYGGDASAPERRDRGQGDTAKVRLVHWDPQAEEKLAAALLYRHSDRSYEEVWQRALALSPAQRQQVIQRCVAEMGPHDSPVREFEVVDYTFEFLLDYGAYREFKRHRMQSYIPQPLTVAHGYRIPHLLEQAGLKEEFKEAIGAAEEGYRQVREFSSLVAQYLATHAHYRRVLSRMNLRECYHLFKLRTSKQAHPSIREPMLDALDQAKAIHPTLFEYIRLRD